jgi:hypothetical protein
MRAQRKTAIRCAGVIGSLVAIVGGLLLASGSAQAAWVTIVENGLPGHLSLFSDPLPADLLELSPGAPVQWQIKADLEDAYSPLTIQFEREGNLVDRPDGLWIQVRACETEWTNFPSSPQCASAETVLAPTAANSPSLGHPGTADSSTPSYSAGALRHGVGKYLLVTLSLPDTPQARADSSLMGLTATVGIGLTVLGDQEDPGTRSHPAGLADTGADALGTVLIALGAVGLGVVFRSRRGRRTTTAATS